MTTNSLLSFENCQICHSNQKKYFQVKEMMFGTQDKFDYIFCQQCETISLMSSINDWSKYYPQNYYSKSPLKYQKKIYHIVKKYLFKHRFLQAIFRNNLIGRIFEIIKPSSSLSHIKLIFEPLNINFHSKILDVGCGSGELLCNMKDAGFLNLKGLDPFLEKDIIYQNGLQIKKEYLSNIKEQYDLIMLNHSFEHMEDPHLILKDIYRILNSDGVCLIRIPISSSYAWRKYQDNWVQLDSPRHIHIYSVKSFSLLAKNSNFEISKVVFDSNEFQFWGSEQYEMGIPLTHAKSHAVDIKNSIFNKKTLQEFKKMSELLNEIQQGDQAIFYLKKKTI